MRTTSKRTIRKLGVILLAVAARPALSYYPPELPPVEPSEDLVITSAHGFNNSPYFVLFDQYNSNRGQFRVYYDVWGQWDHIWVRIYDCDGNRVVDAEEYDLGYYMMVWVENSQWLR